MCNRKKGCELVIYRLIALISSIIRIVYIPNPFEMLEYGYLINIVAEPILHSITFGIVGLYYRRGSYPSLGSILYLIFYCIHTGLLILMGCFEWNKPIIGIIIIAYLGIHYLISRVKQRFISI